MSRRAGFSSNVASALAPWPLVNCLGCGFRRSRRFSPADPWLREPHYPPKTKSVIFLFMAGAPSHLELFDYKPQLAKFDGTLPPKDLLKGYRAAFINPNSTLLGPKFKFARYGNSGAELSSSCRI